MKHSFLFLYVSISTLKADRRRQRRGKKTLLRTLHMRRRKNLEQNDCKVAEERERGGERERVKARERERERDRERDT